MTGTGWTRVSENLTVINVLKQNFANSYVNLICRTYITLGQASVHRVRMRMGLSALNALRRKYNLLMIIRVLCAI